MRRTYLVCVSCLVVAWGSHSVRAEFCTDPVGFVTWKIQGTNGVPTKTALSYLGLAVAHPMIAAGQIAAVHGATVVDPLATWSADTLDASAGGAYLEFTSGPHAGMSEDIVTAAAGAGSVVLASDLSTLLEGDESYRIRFHWTLAEAFGAHNEAGLKAGSAKTADNILVLNPVAQTTAIYFYSPGGALGTGWRQVGAGAVDAGDTVLYLDQGIAVLRRDGPSRDRRLYGAAKLGPTLIPVERKKACASNVYAAGVSLASSGLHTGRTTCSLLAGTAAKADKVQIFDPATQAYATYYYSAGGLTGTGWRQVGSGNAVVVPLGGVLIVQRKSCRAPFNWTALPPY
jgi:uncharacterized protein (TIGR02597 family)